MKKVTAIAPATIANVSCGFDVFGMAIHHPFDRVEAILNQTREVTITQIQGDGGLLPIESHLNTAGVAVISLLKHLNADTGVELSLTKGLPLGSGMGSSAASAVAALVAVNHALKNPLTKKELLPFALEAERIACGAAHADNVAPSLLGGFVLIRDHKTLDVIPIKVPDDLHGVLIHPHIEIKTSDARQALRKNLPLQDAVTQWANASALIAGLLQEDYNLIGRSLQDVVAEPVRSIFIPGYYQVKESALKAGALGCGISGSGPSLFALCKGEPVATNVLHSMKKTFDDIGLLSDVYLSKVNLTGATIIE